MTLRIKDKLSDDIEILIKSIIGAAINVHKELGPGYLEKVYEKAMCIELSLRNIPYETQVPVWILYKGSKIHGQVLDMVVKDKVILEFKTVDNLISAHEAQLLSYMKSTGLSAGLLINFKEHLVKDGIMRFVQTNRI